MLVKVVVVPATSSFSTWHIVEVDGDNGEDGSAAEFLEHQKCAEIIERALREIFGT